MKIKKAVKIAGNVLTIVALVLIVRKLMQMDVDYSILLKRDNILWMAALTILYGFHIAMIPFAWYLILPITTGFRPPFIAVQNVFLKSNLLKYIPGNVFQYVGRNEIAVRYDLRHRDVAFSTVLDIVANIAGSMIIALICYGTGFQEGLLSIGARLSWPIIGAAVAVCAVVGGLLLYKMTAIRGWIRKLCTKENLVRYAGAIAHYMFYAVYTGVIYYVILTRILGVSIDTSTTFVVVGAYQISWLLGFIMPGAPGGIGIRETVMTALLGSLLPVESALLAIVLYRVVNTLGDVVGFLGNEVVYALIKRRSAEGT